MSPEQNGDNRSAAPASGNTFQAHLNNYSDQGGAPQSSNHGPSFNQIAEEDHAEVDGTIGKDAPTTKMGSPKGSRHGLRQRQTSAHPFVQAHSSVPNYTIMSQSDLNLLKLKDVFFKKFIKDLKLQVNARTSNCARLDNVNDYEKFVFFKLLEDFMNKKKERKSDLKVKALLNKISDHQVGSKNKLQAQQQDQDAVL